MNNSLTSKLSNYLYTLPYKEIATATIHRTRSFINVASLLIGLNVYISTFMHSTFFLLPQKE